MNLISIIGNNGSGKTFFLNFFGYKFKRTIYSNFKLKYKNYIPLKITDIINMDALHEGNIFLDEAYAWLESRTSGKALNLLTSYLIYQKRKRLLDIYLTFQMYSSIDKRARYMSNIIVECEPRTNENDDFYYTITDKDKKKVSNFMIPYKIALKYFKYYDTNEIIEPFYKKKLEFDIIKDNPDLLNPKLIEIQEIITPLLKDKFTHDNIKNKLLFNKFDIRYEKYLYPFYHGD